MRKIYQKLLVLVLGTVTILSSCSSDDSVSLPDLAVAETWTSGFSLEWQIGGGEILLQLSESEAFDVLLIDSTTTNRRGIEFSGLESSTSYFLRYQFTDGGSSDFSAPISIVTTDLAAPQRVEVEKVIGDEIGLAWNEVRGAQVEIQISTNSSFESLLEGFDNLVTENNTILLDPLEQLTTYYIRLRSVNNDAASDWNTLDAITTTDQLFFTLKSADFGHNEKIPSKYSCNNASPELNWKNAPADALSFAIVMIDLDFQNGFNHMILFNIPTNISQIPAQSNPAGSTFGTNDLGGTNYFGPCPPNGETHRYLFTIYALDAPVQISSTVRNDEFLAAIEDSTIEKGVLIGLFR